MRYLENPICKLKPLFKIGTKKNIISLSFFQAKGGYKPLNFYMTGIEMLSEKIKKDLPEFKIRIFIDNRVYNNENIMKRLKKINIVELVLFRCPKFLTFNNFHIGLFGTFLRFFPLFDFKNNDAKDVIVLDADYRPDQYPKTSQHLFMDSTIENYKRIRILDESKNLKFFYNSESLMRELNFYEGSMSYPGYFVPYVTADGIGNFKRLKKKILLDFLFDVQKYGDKYTLYSNELLNTRRKVEDPGSFVFGVDEYFLNKVLIDDIMKNKTTFGFVYYVNVMTKLRNIKNTNKKCMDSIIDEAGVEDVDAFYKTLRKGKIFDEPEPEGKKELKKVYKYIYSEWKKGNYLCFEENYLNIIFNPKIKNKLIFEKLKINFGKNKKESDIIYFESEV